MKREQLLNNAKPILFNTDMVRAILDGRKTVTRRVVKKDRIKPVLKSDYRKDNHDIPDSVFIKKLVKMPYEVGDILYVRETWTLEEFYDGEALIKFRAGGNIGIDYECEGDTYNKLVKYAHDKWVPSLFMPKEAARIFLKVTDVRVERLQDITIEQICREGVEVEYPHVLNGEEKICAFSQLWNSTIKKSDVDLYGWDANPWVWVIEFERIEMEE